VLDDFLDLLFTDGLDARQQRDQGRQPDHLAEAQVAGHRQLLQRLAQIGFADTCGFHAQYALPHRIRVYAQLQCIARHEYSGLYEAIPADVQPFSRNLTILPCPSRQCDHRLAARLAPVGVATPARATDQRQSSGCRRQIPAPRPRPRASKGAGLHRGGKKWQMQAGRRGRRWIGIFRGVSAGFASGWCRRPGRRRDSGQAASVRSCRANGFFFRRKPACLNSGRK
jgi:hypothetical protein